jgi:hypothetical protein
LQGRRAAVLVEQVGLGFGSGLYAGDWLGGVGGGSGGLALAGTEQEVVHFVLQLRLLLVEVEAAVVVTQTASLHVPRLLEDAVATLAAVGGLGLDYLDVGLCGEGVAGRGVAGRGRGSGEVVVVGVHEADDGTLLGLQRSHLIVLFVIIDQQLE